MKKSEPSPPGAKVAQTDAAALLGVAHTSVKRAKTIYEHGTPEQIIAMERGAIALRPTAEKLSKNALANARKGKRRDRTAPYEPETKRQHERANGQKRRMVDSLSTIRGHCRGLSDFDIGMAIAACNTADLKHWAQVARENARILGALAAQLERNLQHGIKTA